jgi:hypothetical protein
MSSQPWANVFYGTVISVKRWSDTYVSSVTTSGSGYFPQTRVNTSVVNRSEIFIKSTDGEEKSFDLSASKVPMREGSKVVAVWGSDEGLDRGLYMYVENLDTKDVYAPKVPYKGWYIFNGFGLVFVLGIVMTICLLTLSHMPVPYGSNGFYTEEHVVNEGLIKGSCPKPNPNIMCLRQPGGRNYLRTVERIKKPYTSMHQLIIFVSSFGWLFYFALVPVWIVWGVIKARERRKEYLNRRKDMMDSINRRANEHGMSFSSADLIPFQLRRA